MAENMNGAVRPDRATYIKNRCSHSLAELAQYGNQWVAWSADGARVIAHHPDLSEAAAMVKAQRIDMEDVNFEWIPPGGEVDTLL
jgi:hypothetical protein